MLYSGVVIVVVARRHHIFLPWIWISHTDYLLIWNYTVAYTHTRSLRETEKNMRFSLVHVMSFQYRLVQQRHAHSVRCMAKYTITLNQIVCIWAPLKERKMNDTFKKTCSKFDPYEIVEARKCGSLKMHLRCIARSLLIYNLSVDRFLPVRAYIFKRET